MSVLNIVKLMLLALLLSACASGVSRQARVDAKSEGVTAQTISANGVRIDKKNPLVSLSLTLSDEAKQKHLDNLKFNPDALLATIRRGLESSGYLASSKNSGPEMNIIITDMRMRSTYSAVLLGILAGTDSIEGNVIVKDPKGVIVDKYAVSVSYGLGGVMGSDESRTGWLYEKFSEELIKELIESQK